jgi:hypothetical protein
MRQHGLTESTASDYTFRVLAITAKKDFGYAEHTDPGAMMLALITLWRLRNYWESDRCEKMTRGGVLIDERL